MRTGEPAYKQVAGSNAAPPTPEPLEIEGSALAPAEPLVRVTPWTKALGELPGRQERFRRAEPDRATRSSSQRKLISRAFRWQRANVIHEGKEEGLPYFFCRLNPPRPSFALDMTDEEQALMEEHGAYWTGHVENGKVVIFGVVGDPAGPWGASIVEVADEGAAQALTVEDPVIVHGDGFSYDIFPMPNAVAPSARRGSTDL